MKRAIPLGPFRKHSWEKARRVLPGSPKPRTCYICRRCGLIRYAKDMTRGLTFTAYRLEHRKAETVKRAPRCNAILEDFQ